MLSHEEIEKGIREYKRSLGYGPEAAGQLKPPRPQQGMPKEPAMHPTKKLGPFARLISAALTIK